MSQGLFHQEVIGAKRGEWMGSIIVAPPLSRWLLTSLALAAAIQLLLSFGDYTCRETLTAQQVPSAGPLNVAAPSAGTITGLHVHDDQLTTSGAVRLQFSSEQDSVTLGGTHALVRQQTILLKQGQQVGAGQPLLLILPADFIMQIQLLVSGRAIGFVEPGNRVVLRYQAFPKHKFDQKGGLIMDISPGASGFVDLAALIGQQSQQQGASIQSDISLHDMRISDTATAISIG